jgi:hypothetical protein
MDEPATGEGKDEREQFQNHYPTPSIANRCTFVAAAPIVSVCATASSD